MRKLLSLLLLLTVFPAAASDIEAVRLWSAPDHTRLVFDISSPLEHKLFQLHDPERLVIDFEQTGLRDGVNMTDLLNRHLAGVRHARKKNGDLRVVLDLKQKVHPKSFLLKPNQRYGDRLVIDLLDLEGEQGVPKVAKSASDIKNYRDVVVAIDAGHGGEDPGALGKRYKSREKVITLQIAERLKRLIDAEPGMRAVLTRTGDYYVGLRKRMDLARKHHADLFVSIHADAFRDHRAKGSSVYVLSRRGASSEAARWLAESENAADLVGGVSLDDKDKVLASVLLDLSQSATQQVSLSAAQEVQDELQKIGKIHGNRENVQKAGFLVLKSPDIPSMLVETGFISNPQEEAKLASAKGQQLIAKAVFEGVRGYFNSEPPPDTLLAQRKRGGKMPVTVGQSTGAGAQLRHHITQRGDTLIGIASRYQVSLAELRRENRLKDDLLRVGQQLRIPEG